ncbi:hypothetical protein OHA70_22690 [Kribbella sp. NBC_00382]|uniref:hypothetical protein n=1 Tax=Kribbella sp. NBC_00382 TaxID=2975967 RepID=UPI002E236E7D
MFDQMSMPVLFAVLISTLAVVSIGVFIAVRVMGERVATPRPKAAVPASSHPQELPAASPAITDSTPPSELT